MNTLSKPMTKRLNSGFYQNHVPSLITTKTTNLNHADRKKSHRNTVKTKKCLTTNHTKVKKLSSLIKKTVYKNKIQ